LMIEELKVMARKVREMERSLPASYEKGEELRQGADGSPTLAIDQAAEDIIIEHVRSRDLPVNILSEEAGFIDNGKKGVLVIDPVDGTHNCVTGIPFYAVSLAAGSSRMSDITAGVVMNLVTGETYWAEKGKGAFKDDRPIRVREYSPFRSFAMVYMGKYSSPEDFRVAKQAVRARALGCASLEMCLVAEGKADAYYMNCEVHEKSIRVIDIAASSLILREAGGEIVDLTGRPLDMGFDLAERSNILAYGDPKAKEEML
jgi:fructose-1,6-bisphosphatase/inositol monophosphatase family enzyme